MERIVLLLVVVSGLAGCLAGPGPGPAKADGSPGTDDPGDAVPGNATRVPTAEATAPSLEDGTTFTYRSEGLYNLDGTFNVTVRRQASGYLFAGVARADLVEEVVWDRVWFGPQDEELNPVDEQGTVRRLFDFPLRANRTWRWDGDDGPVVEVLPGKVPVPGEAGTEPGYRMTMETDGGTYWTWTYAPSVGYVTRLTSRDDETTYDDLTLIEVGTADAATWFEPATETAGVCAGGTEPTGQTTLPVSGAASIVASVGVNGRGTAAIQPPPASQMGPVAWFWPGGDRTWTYTTIDAADGDWSLAASSPDAYACAFARGVAWTDV